LGHLKRDMSISGCLEVCFVDYFNNTFHHVDLSTLMFSFTDQPQPLIFEKLKMAVFFQITWNIWCQLSLMFEVFSWTSLIGQFRQLQLRVHFRMPSFVWDSEDCWTVQCSSGYHSCEQHSSIGV